MEFQAYNVLVIASDIRQLEHIEYARHQILFMKAQVTHNYRESEYAEYLRRFGEIGCKAISSDTDYQMYEAIRLLSIVEQTLHKQLLTKLKSSRRFAK
jgi:phenylalanine-4-hydroxylase